MSEALGTAGANIPEDARHGGMTVKFVQSSDNKYVQYRLMANQFSTTVADWQGVDETPVVGSNNLVESGGVEFITTTLQQELEISTSDTGIITHTISEFTEQGLLAADGKVYDIDNPAMKTSPYYLIDSIDHIYVQRLWPDVNNFVGGVFYDSNLHVISTINVNTDNGLIINSSDYSTAKYLRVCGYSSALNIKLYCTNGLTRHLPIINLNYDLLKNKYANLRQGIINALLTDYADVLKIDVAGIYSIVYTQYMDLANAIVAFDSNDNVIGGHTLIGSYGSIDEFVIPDGCDYVAITIHRENFGDFKCGFKNKTVVIPSDHVAEEFIGNLIDKTKIIAGKYVRSNGNLDNNSDTSVTDLIPLKPNTKYYQWRLYKGYYCFFDSNMNVIAGMDNTGTSIITDTDFTTPANTAFGRFTIISTVVESSYINIAGDGLPGRNITELNYTRPYLYDFNSNKDICDPCGYNGKEFSTFNKVLFIGDSLIEGACNTPSVQANNVIRGMYSIPTFVTKHSGVETVNLGWAGATAGEWWVRHQSDDLSGYDACVIHIGVNDALKNYSQSDWINTMLTNIGNIINKVKNENNRIKIFVSSVVASPIYSYRNTNLKSAMEAIEVYVNQYSYDYIYFIDVHKYGHSGDKYAYSAGHLTALGYNRAAMDFINIISWTMANNLDDFRNTQFVGTEYQDWEGL